MKKKENRRSLVIIALLVLVGTISIGYALMSSNLLIKGTTEVTPETWDVHFENIANASASSSDVTVVTPAHIVEATTTPTVASDDLNVEFSVSFKKPDDKYEFDVDVVNDGSLYVKCTDITPTVPSALAPYIEITYTGLAENDVLTPTGATNSKTMHVVAKFKNSVTELPTSTLSGDLTIGIEFEQTNPTV